MEGAKRRWKGACFGLGIIGYLFLLYLFLPWRDVPDQNIEIWTPPGYSQISEGNQAVLVKKWMEGKPRLEVSSEMFKSMKFQTAYVFGKQDMSSVNLTYLGEIEGAPIFYYTEYVRAITGGQMFYLVKEIPQTQKNGIVTVQFAANWLAAVVLLGLFGIGGVFMVFVLLYNLGIWVIATLGQRLTARRLAN
ncbi:MAG: hypothetical protein Q8O75_02455 [bacterium]|nr:hypothetical protein [bacterium]